MTEQTLTLPDVLPRIGLIEIILKAGGHSSRAQAVCAMEAVAWLAGEPHSDQPQCACPVIGSFMRSWNDAIQTDEKRNALLKPLLPLLVGAIRERRRAMNKSLSRDKTFHELKVGDFIADMHYGIEPVKARFDVVAHVRWDEPRPLTPTRSGYVEHAFYDYLQGFLNGNAYNNKLLHVIGFHDDSTLTHPVLICGYCYDGRRSGIVLIKEKAPSGSPEDDR